MCSLLDVGATIKASTGGGANVQFELGDMDPSALSSTVVASSSASDNGTGAGCGACTFPSKLVGLCARGIPPLWVPEFTWMFGRFCSATPRPLARLSLPLCDPICIVDGLREPDGDVLRVFASRVLDARVFCPSAFD